MALPVAVMLGAKSAMITMVVCFSAITSYLLFSQFFATRFRPLVILGTAYYYATLMGIPYLLGYTGINVGQIGTGAGTAWLSIFWTTGFSCLIIAYALVQGRDRAQLGSKDALRLMFNMLLGSTAIAFLLVLTIAVVPWLPQPGGRSVGYLLVSLSAAALVTTSITTRGRTVLHLWLLVALVALLLDVTLTTMLKSNATLGWYVAVGYRALTATLLLIPLLSELTAVSARMSMLAGLDGLTGLPNRRALDDRIEAYLNDGRRRSDSLSVLMIDIDHFKPFNDTYGHAAGDEALRAVGKAISRALSRAGDFVARYGGEEFVSLLPDTDRDGAMVVAERVRSAVARIPLKYMVGHQRLTVSIGLASVRRTEIASSAQILGMADRALYHAKASGRNCVSEVTATLGVVRAQKDKDRQDPRGNGDAAAG